MDWLDEWDAERKNAAVKPPAGFYTINQIADRLNLQLGRVRDMMRREVADGQMERKEFLGHNEGGRLVMINYYRRIVAPSATKPRPLKSGTGQNGSSVRRARK